MKTGLVLSGGGARGFAQIGVLKVLKNNNIKIDAISGCSIGALIGACYAYDYNIEKIEKLLLKIQSSKDIYDYSFSLKGLLKGQKLQQHISEYFKEGDNVTFKNLKIPLSINATNIVSGEELVFNHGKLIPAIMASLSYPGFFTPRKIENKICVDGGLTNPLPLNHLKDMDFLILVDVSEEKKQITENSNIKDIMMQSVFIMQKRIVEKAIENCKSRYILIRPKIENVFVLDFKKAPNLVPIGEKEAKKQIKKIKKILINI
ncbi:MAG: patatin-like phospholipase family protein [Candidatus Woesearchaeota archaeon]